MRLFKSKKGYTLADLPTIALLFGIAVITLSIVAQITSDVRATQCGSDGFWWNSSDGTCNENSTSNVKSGGVATNVSTSGLEGMKKLGDWFPTIGLVLGAVIVIGALGMLFMGRKK